MELTNWVQGGILTAFVSFITWALTQAVQSYRLYKEDIRIKKQVLYNLLEIHYSLKVLDPVKTELLAERFMSRIPVDQQTDEMKMFFNKKNPFLINSVVMPNVANSLSRVEQRYTTVIENLSKIDPIMAFELSGKAAIIHVFDLLRQYFAAIGKSLPGTQPTSNDSEMVLSLFQPEIVRDAIDNLKDDIEDVAKSIGRQMLKKTKKKLQASVESHQEMIDDIDQMIDKVLRLINAAIEE